ncbi:transmembrane protein 216-like [Trichosurus vulpecula]|uniref:transmembrane protein 216-like n=1 Tax=Trichosurus vulpecula TaxID=9337 RepID=UPI00186B0214|nr:transmembrane protein 216-like [Trichosurus vulpecula]
MRDGEGKNHDYVPSCGPPTGVTPQRRNTAHLTTSISLEILLFLNGWYSTTYFLLELFVFMYKGLLLPYPTANLVLDLVILFLYLGIEIIHLFIATKGNLCQRMMPLGINLAMTFPSAMMASYYLLLQTYILRLKAEMSTILLLFCGLELMLEAITLTTFNSMDSY